MAGRNGGFVGGQLLQQIGLEVRPRLEHGLEIAESIEDQSAQAAANGIADDECADDHGRCRRDSGADGKVRSSKIAERTTRKAPKIHRYILLRVAA